MTTRQRPPGPTEICESLVAEAARLCGAQRALLVLDSAEGPLVTARLMPQGETDAALLHAITPWLSEARRAGKARLRHGPAGADKSDQRSCIVAPLLSGHEPLGFLYTDVEGRHGRFTAADRDLLAVLAGQAAAALANADFGEGLARRLEQRTAELAVIDSIQEGMAAELDFQAIVDLVGDKLREVFRSDDLTIAWFDAQMQTLDTLYSCEHGRPLPLCREPVRPGGPLDRVLNGRETLVAGTRAEMDAMGYVLMAGTDPSLAVMTVPIVTADRVVGSIMIESFERQHAFAESDVRLLQTVASAMGVALQSARLFDETQRLLKETEQRNAELAVINSIQEGLAAELDYRAIIDLVGDRLRGVLGYDNLGIRFFDLAAGTMEFPYEYEHGKRLSVPSMRMDYGAWSKQLLEECRPLVMQTVAEQEAMGFFPSPGTAASMCGVVVPFPAGDRRVGAIAVDDYERTHAFDGATVRLLQTVAATMGVALENARLFDETQRLLKDTEQRNAELAVINSIQQSVVAALDFQAIVDVVGDKLREVFATGDMSIRWWEEAAGEVHYLYAYEHGVRLPNTVKTPQPGTVQYRFYRERGQATIIGSVAEQLERGIPVRPGTDRARSLLIVPMVAGERMLGSVALENHERDHAFGPAELRLLQTVASSMGVALENARLFAETQRLLKETERRNAELALINSIQQGMAAKLEFQAIVDLVGDTLLRVLDLKDIDIRWFDHEARTVHVLYAVEHGVRLSIDAAPIKPGGRWDSMIETRKPLVTHTAAEEMELHGVIPGTDAAKCSAVLPIIANDRVLGVLILDNHEREHAFEDAEVRLLGTVVASMGVALENARLFDETQRLLEETQRRARESSALSDVGRDLSSSLDLSVVMDRIASHAKGLLEASSSAIFLPDAGGRTHRAIVAVGVAAEAIKATVIETGIASPFRTGTGSVIQSGQLISALT